MATHQFIEPFPADIDRNAFGNWFSGFTDGEGCFFMKINQDESLSSSFYLTLRDDDIAILHLVISYLQCGRLNKLARKTSSPTKPACRIVVSRLSDIRNTIIPHFDRFPLRSKKARDFAIWREAALLPRDRNGGRDLPYGTRERFIQLHDELREVRKYTKSPVPFFLSARPATREHQSSLFD